MLKLLSCANRRKILSFYCKFSKKSIIKKTLLKSSILLFVLILILRKQLIQNI